MPSHVMLNESWASHNGLKTLVIQSKLRIIKYTETGKKLFSNWSHKQSYTIISK